MERTLIAPGVHLSCDPASKFNRCRISIHFAFPAERKTATAHALLPLVMERGYADCPDMTQLTKKLAKLYGADLTVDARPMGCNHNLCVSVTGIKDAFALEGEALTTEYTKIALGAAFHPYLVDGCFDPQAVSIEKQMLKKGLEDEINDKRIYCLHQANREFFGDSPAGVRQEGYLEEVDGLTPTMLTAAYRQMLRIANIELLVLGCDAAQTAAIRDALLAELACIDRAPLPLVENMAMPAIAPMHKTENYDMVQAKLCMLFTLGQPMQPQQLAAVRLAMALYGGSVTSRLFLNVRERDHLCYYCSSSFQSFTGSMAVNSGVEHADAARAEQAILKELADLCTGPITDEEFEDCRRGLLSGMNGVEDSLGLRVILNGLGKDAAYIISRINGFTYVQTEYDIPTQTLTVVKEIPFSEGERAAVKCYGANDVMEGVAIMKKEDVQCSITGNSTNPVRFQHLVAGTYKKWAIENGKKYFSVASGGGTGRTLHPDNVAAGPASYGLTDSLGRVHGDAQFAGSSSVPAHVEMMGLIGMGNNPMVGATVACAVAAAQANA